MSMLIQHNMAMINANRQLNLNTKSKVKSAEKLSSGYRINRAADDAAGLSISEKMRWMIRGLNKGTENAQDGVSWVQIGDGSLEETHAMLHRMTELAIKASNETCTDADRAFMQAEFNQLQKEVDRLTDNTYFNEKHIFNEHEIPFYQIEGATSWPQNMIHTVRMGENDLVMTYREHENDTPKQVSVSVPPGSYTTRELIDEIDTAFENAGLLKAGLGFEYTPTGFCNLNLEGGEKIDEVTGGLSYLLFENYGGGTLGALIGTTVFAKPTDKIQIADEDKANGVIGNDKISFKLLDPEDPNEEKGPAQTVELDLDGGGQRYDKLALMDALKEALIDAGVNPDADGDKVADEEIVKVDHYGTNIMMFSEKYIISEFKGNMFEVDDYANYTSIFYDNIHHVENITYTNAQFQGGNVLQVTRSGDLYDPEASVFHFDDSNNKLVLRPNGKEKVEFNLTNLDGNGTSLDGMDMSQVCTALNAELTRRYGAGNEPVKFEAVMPYYAGYDRYDDYQTVRDNNGRIKEIGYTAMRITATEAEPGKTIGVSETESSAYTTLFTKKSETVYKNDAKFGGNDTKTDSNAKLTGGRDLSGGLAKVTNANNAFHIDIGWADGPGLSADIVLGNKDLSGYTLDELKNEIQDKLNAAFKDVAPANMKDDQGRVIVVSSEGGHIVLTGATDKTSQIRVSEVPGNQGYDDIFPDEKLKPNHRPAGTALATSITLPESAVIDAQGKVIIPSAHDGRLIVEVDGYEKGLVDANGKETSTTALDLYGAAPNKDGKWDSLDQLAAYINEKLRPTVTEITFSDVNKGGTSSTVTPPGNVTAKGDSTTFVPDTYSATGKTTWNYPLGQAGYMTSNTDPKLVMKTAINLTANPHVGELKFHFKGQGIPKDKQDFTLNLDKDYTDLETLRRDVETALNNHYGYTGANQYGHITVSKESIRGGQTLGFSVYVGGTADDAWVGEGETVFSIDTSSEFLKDIHTTKSTGTMNISATDDGDFKGVNKKFTPSGGAKLVFNVKGSATPVTVTLQDGKEYDRDALETAIKTVLNPLGYTVACDRSNGNLTITTGAGSDYEITLDASSSTALKYMYGYSDAGYAYTKGEPATATIGRKVQDEFTIGPDDKKNFKITVDGQDYEISLDEGTYGTKTGQKNIGEAIRDKVNALSVQTIGRKVLDEQTTPLTSGGILQFKTTSSNGPWNDTTKTGSQIKINYDKDSAMLKIFGSTQRAGVHAEFVDEGGGKKLQLTRITDSKFPDSTSNNMKSIYVTSDELRNEDGKIPEWGHSQSYQGGSFIYSDKKDFEPEYDDGYHSPYFSYMQGVSLADKLTNGKIEINEHNSKLTFYYTDRYGEAGATPIPVSLDILNAGEKSKLFTPEELRKRLQEKINEKTINPGDDAKLKVTLKDGGLRVEAGSKGRKYRIYTKDDGAYRPTGGFYDKVLCSGQTKENGIKIAWDRAGQVEGGEVYAVGRQDVKNKEIKIQKDGNDDLSLEFTVPNWPEQPVKLKMKLTPGYYKGDSLVKMVQEKLNQALKNAGLPEGLIEAGIGNVHETVQVVGAINDRALAFKLSDTVKGPGMGGYGIEAIGGTAAYSIFYATEGDLARAYIMGGRDISKGVEIKSGATDFSVDVDGTTYSINLKPGFYTPDQLIEHINDQMQVDNNGNKVPLKAYNDNGHVKLMHIRYGKYKISNLRGSVKDQLFFSERGKREEEDQIHLRLSSVSGDWIDIERPWMNTMSLGINSLTVSKVKYAQKAITRLKEAVTKTSDVRSYFGATQNRLESTIRNNMNKAENTTAAESRIRDTDIARETVENSIHSILEQTGTSMLAQAKQNAQLALQMLS